MKNNTMSRLSALALTVIIAVTATGCNNAVTSGEQTSSGETSQVAEIPNAKVSISDGKFNVDGKELWINGANTPWQNWNDFSGNMDEEFWDKTFEELVSDGINCTRIWINCNGENVVRLKSTGAIKGINEQHWDDLDKLFALAEKHRIYIMPTLLSFDHFKNTNSSAEKWRKLATSKENCDDYAEQYVKEFCKRYGENEYLFGIDLMNEPDWVHENSECGQLKWSDLCYLFGKCASVIHETCSTPVTVGLGIVKYNSDKYEGDKISDENLKKVTGDDKAYVDFYSTHYYMWEKQYFGFPFDKTPEQFGLTTDKPCLIGETSNDDEKEAGITLTEKYKSTYENGWNGLMVWMEPRTDEEYTWYRYDLTKTATNAMLKLIPEKIDPLGVHGYSTSDTSESGAEESGN